MRPLDYPHELSPEARDRIEREKIRACRELLPASAYKFKDQELAVRCIMRIFLSFAKELCAFRNEHSWPLDRVQRESEEFLRRLTITIVFAKFPGCDRHWISNWNGSIESNMERRLKGSSEWAQYEELLLADIGTKAAPSTSVAKTRSTGFMPGQFEGTPDWQLKELMQRRLEAAGRARVDENHTPESPDPILEAFGRNDTTVASEQSPAQNSGKTVQSTGNNSKDRQALVEAYIEEVRRTKGKRITKKDIWSSAGYKTRTEFERWVRQDRKRPNKAAHDIFTRLLCVEKPHLK